MFKIENIKLAAFDLDGTLLNSQHKISEGTKRSIASLKEKGIEPIIATGRSYEAMKFVLKELDLTGPVICYNGAMVLDGSTGKILRQWTLPVDIAQYSYNLAKEMNLFLLAYKEGVLYFERECEESHFYENLTGLTPRYTDFSTWAPADFNFTKTLAIDEPSRENQSWPELQIFEEKIKKHFGPRVYTAFSRPFFVEVIEGSCSKGQALQFIAEQRGLQAHQVAAFGDALNDSPMLEYAGCSVAMKNGLAPVKELARYTTNFTCDEDGVAKFINKNF